MSVYKNGAIRYFEHVRSGECFTLREPSARMLRQVKEEGCAELTLDQFRARTETVIDKTAKYQ